MASPRAPPEHLGVYNIKRVSLPSVGQATPLVSLLSPESLAWQQLLDESQLLLSPDEFGALQREKGDFNGPYFDPVLRNSDTEYRGFLELLHGKGLLAWTRTPRDRVGAFFVNKKSGQLRLILDARGPNLRFRRPPRLHMASAAAFPGWS